MIYKLKHEPTGLYYQPIKSGSNLSARGKIYQTAANGLSEALRYKQETFIIYVNVNTALYRKLKDIIVFTECRWKYSEMESITKISDWKIEEIL